MTVSTVHRSDLVLVCSSVELELLTDQYQISKTKLQLAPFFIDCQALGTGPSRSFYQRQHLMTIGNFRYLAIFLKTPRLAIMPAAFVAVRCRDCHKEDTTVSAQPHQVLPSS